MKNIFFCTALLLMVSCGIFKSKHKEVVKSKQDSRELVETVNDSSYSKVDKSIINTKTTFKGTIPVPGVKLTDNRPYDPLIWYKGVTLIADGLYTVRQTLDSVSGHLNTIVEKGSENIPVDYSSETNQQNNITEQGTTSDKTKSDKKKSESNEKLIKDSQPAKVGNFTLIILGSVLIIGVLLFIYFRGYRKK